MVFKMLRQLHDFIKNNYEQRKYEEAEKEYQTWQMDYDYAKVRAKQNKISDYQLGYNQAISDYQKDGIFHQYPEYLAKVANDISSERLCEIENFLKGYHDSKIRLSQDKDLKS